jgi:hypothetical protein
MCCHSRIVADPHDATSLGAWKRGTASGLDGRDNAPAVVRQIPRRRLPFEDMDHVRFQRRSKVVEISTIMGVV